MSSCFPTPTLGGSITQEIAAAPDVVWSVVTDRENAEEILSNLKSKTVIKNGNEDGVGMVVREVRVMDGTEIESFNTITAISRDPYSVSTNVYLKKSTALAGKDKAARTGSWTIMQGENENSSVFVWTFSAIPEGFVETFWTLLCGKCVFRMVKKHFEQDLRDFAAEAERRQRLIDEKSENVGVSRT